MDTGLIIALAVVALLVIVGLALAGRASRGRRQEKQREHAVESRRHEVVDGHKNAAHEGLQAAQAAEQHARIQRAEAEKQIAEAELTAQGHRDGEIAADLHGNENADRSEDRDGRFTRTDPVAGDTPATAPADTRRS